MNKKILIVLLITRLFLPLFGQEQAKVKEYSGKVTFKEPGREWQPAEKGMNVAMGTTLSTGFNSTAVLDLGTSELFMKALTRMTLEELIRAEKTVTTKVFLNAGRVRAKVKTGEDLTHDFICLSSISTASVRGTDFEFDGERIKAIEGVVFISNAVGQTRTVFAGEESETTRYETPKRAEEQKIAAAQVSPSTAAVTPPAVTLAATQVMESVQVTEAVQAVTLTVD
ncbi:MAG: hypothetical protein AB1798_13485 [Spirochaetota bacterium]